MTRRRPFAIALSQFFRHLFVRQKTKSSESLPLHPDAQRAIEALRDAIADLKTTIAELKHELYAFNIEYASSHFSLQSSMHGKKIEAWRRVGVQSETAFLQRRCDEVENRIAVVRGLIAEAGLNPD